MPKKAEQNNKGGADCGWRSAGGRGRMDGSNLPESQSLHSEKIKFKLFIRSTYPTRALLSAKTKCSNLIRNIYLEYMTQFETPGRDVPFPGATGISDQVCFASSNHS